MDTQSLIAAMDDATFRRLLDGVIRKHLEELENALGTPLPQEDVVEALHSPDLIDRSYQVLVLMKRSVEGQLSARKADFARDSAQTPMTQEKFQKLTTQYQTWRGGAIRFKGGLEEFLSFTKAARDGLMDHDVVALKKDRDRYLVGFAALKGAVGEHRNSFPTDDEPSYADEVLWNLAEEL